MHLSQAIIFLQTDLLSHSTHQTWADLGCGTGTFTLALAALLPVPSIIHAVDKDEAALRNIPNQHHQIIIEKHQGDFIKTDFLFNNLDGILMANSLHYVKDKITLIQTLQTYLHENGCFLIVEYETSFANPWVPYPIRFQALERLFAEAGFNLIQKINEIPSRYQGKMYAALIQKS